MFVKFYLSFGGESTIKKKLNNQTIMKLSLMSHEAEAICNGDYDKKEINFLKKIINVNNNILDVGANVGFYTIALANHIHKNNGNGKIFAYEPEFNNFKSLKTNVSLNKFERYVVINNFGLSNANKEAELVLREGYEAGSITGNASITSSEEMDRNFKRQIVKLKKFDEIFLGNYNLGFVDLIKVDIEGHEDSFFEGSARFISKHKPLILFELNKPFYTSRNIFNFDNLFFKPIASLGYDFYLLKNKLVNLKTLNDLPIVTNLIVSPIEKHQRIQHFIK